MAYDEYCVVIDYLQRQKEEGGEGA